MMSANMINHISKFSFYILFPTKDKLQSIPNAIIR